MNVGEQGWHSADSTHLAIALLFLEDNTQKMVQLTVKGVFQQNFQECSDFVTISYGESWDSSCEKS